MARMKFKIDSYVIRKHVFNLSANDLNTRVGKEWSD